MPNIPTYEQPNLGLQPTEIGAESFAAAGRRGGAFFNQAGESIANAGARAGRAVATVGDLAVAYEDHQQISVGAAHASQLYASQLEKKDAAIKAIDPNDPAYGPKVEAAVKQWREESLEPALQNFQQEFTTEKSQAWALNFANHTRQEMFVHSTADIANAAHIGVNNAVNTMVNTESSTAYRDPTSVAGAIERIKSSTADLVASSPLRGVDAAKVTSEVQEKAIERVVKAGAIGVAEKSGGNQQAVDAYVDRYSKYFNGAEIAGLARNVRMQERIAQSDARNARITQDYINKQNFNDAANKLEVSTIPTNAGDPPVLPKDYWDTVRKIATMPGVDPSRLRALVENGEHITAKLGKPEPLAPISHETTMNLLDGIRTGKVTSTDDIYKAYGDNKLNNADFHFLQNEFAQRKTPEGERLDKDRETFFKRFAAQFDPYFGQDPKYAGNLYVAEMDARRKEVEVQKAGGDPHSVYDPNSPNFFGKDTSKYKMPLQQLLQQPATSVPPKEPRKPGIYQTPRGPMQWTGTGWIAPAAAAVPAANVPTR